MPKVSELINFAFIPGTSADIYRRLIEQLPQQWFGSNHRPESMDKSDHPVLDTILSSCVTVTRWIYLQAEYSGLQARIQTATGTNLDLIAQDYFRNGLSRHTDENDRTYRKRILANLLQEKSTRFGMQNALYLLTGYMPRIFEPWNPYDCGGYNVSSALAYSTAGNYGSGSFPCQCFIDVYVNQYESLGGYSGFNDNFGGYNAAGGQAALWYGGDSLIASTITDQDIYRLISLTKVYGTICWVRIIRIGSSLSD